MMLAPATEQSRITTISLVVLAAVAIAAALAYTRAVMVPFVLAIFLSYLLFPVVDLLQDRFRVPRVISIILALLVAVGLMFVLGLMITTSTRALFESASIYEERLGAIAERTVAILSRFGIELGDQPLVEALTQLPVGDLLSRTAGTVFGLITTGGLVLIFLIYLLAGRRPQQIRSGIYAEINQKVQRYLVIKFAVSAGTGIVVGLILAAFGLELAFVFGVMAFLLNFIPSIGSVIAVLLPIPIAFIQFESMWPIIGIIAFPGVVQITVGNAIEPILQGEGLELHPVVILLALIFWGLLWGIVGMLLAAPITAVLRIVLARIETTRPVAELLAGRLPPAGGAASPA